MKKLEKKKGYNNVQSQGDELAPSGKFWNILHKLEIIMFSEFTCQHSCSHKIIYFTTMHHGIIFLVNVHGGIVSCWIFMCVGSKK
jgi:hypothetical protein